MKFSQEVRRAAKGLFRLCMVEGELDEKRLRLIIDELITRKPRNYLAILDRLIYLIKSDQQRRVLTITSVSPLGEQEKERIFQEVRGRLPQVNCVCNTVDPEILGGVRLQVGSDVWDYSVEGSLKEVERLLAA
ncbi:MAG: F0F1 ATP synthase subunit delta [Methylacidiphilales bacterium]|nr:F0F1 ATP synthase subunit delta [Candidatus Methylacidiphilales bacterium]MDW8349930.1 F0F1 ATP synthase subunit delta [Verrucomicrobiae bacterium]